MLIRQADEKHQIKAKMLEITNDSNELLKVYFKLYQDLNDMYNYFPNIYKEIQRVVTLPTNDDAERMTAFNQELKQELQFLNDESFLESVLQGNLLENNNQQELEDNMYSDFAMDNDEGSEEEQDEYGAFYDDEEDTDFDLDASEEDEEDIEEPEEGSEEISEEEEEEETKDEENTGKEKEE